MPSNAMIRSDVGFPHSKCRFRNAGYLAGTARASDEHEPAPDARASEARIVTIFQLELRSSKRVCRPDPLPKPFMKARHDRRAHIVVQIPEGAENKGNARRDEWPRQTEHAFAKHRPPVRGRACREDDQPR